MDTTFLVLTLFFPRILLLIYYMKGWIPLNPLPFWGDVVMSVFIPRVLILIYIYHTLGVGGWFWVHIAALILCAGGSSTATSHKSKVKP